MAEFNIESDSVDVTRIMEQIRQRIHEKRGTDYTEQQIRELATVKLGRFLDPRQVRSDLVEHYRHLEPPEPIPYERPGPVPEQFDFDEHTIYASSRGLMGKLIRLIRKLLNPILKLFFNPNPVVFALTRQAEINARTLQLLQHQTDLAERVAKRAAARQELDALNYEVLNNLVVEMTRLSVDMKNHRMLVASVAGRLDFDERRARALESVVQSRSRNRRAAPRARMVRARHRPDLAGPAAGGDGLGDGPVRRPRPARERTTPPQPGRSTNATRRSRRARTPPRSQWTRRHRIPCGRRAMSPHRHLRRSWNGRRHRRRPPHRPPRQLRPRTPNRRRRQRRLRSPTPGHRLQPPRRRLRLRAMLPRRLRPRRPRRSRRRPARGRRHRRAVRLAVVVQRYGAELNGGAELHARYVAEHLARHAEVEVLTTCATDYITWRNELDPGFERVNGVPVRRFLVSRQRDVDEFGRRSMEVFEEPHSVAAELAWLRSEGPTSPSLINHLRRHGDGYDYCIFFSYRYYHAYHGIRVAGPRALLVPTAERDPALGLRIFGGSFRGVRALLYNSYEERALINAVSNNEAVPGVVVGIGSEVPAHPEPQRFRQTTGIEGPVMIYVGRIDENKGCRELFDYFQRCARLSSQLTLVLIGNPVMPIPTHPRIRHLGYVTDPEKFDAMAAADLLVMPSHYESLSMVTLEAWALGRPVLANGRCDVLCGQCIRSNAGLYYESYEEFAETLHSIVSNSALRSALGVNGRAYFNAHYTWPVIERKYLDMLDRLEREDAARANRPQPLPGWFGRRRRDLPPGRQVVDRLPAGPAPRAGGNQDAGRSASGS